MKSGNRWWERLVGGEGGRLPDCREGEHRREVVKEQRAQAGKIAGGGLQIAPEGCAERRDELARGHPVRDVRHDGERGRMLEATVL